MGRYGMLKYNNKKNTLRISPQQMDSDERYEMPENIIEDNSAPFELNFKSGEYVYYFELSKSRVKPKLQLKVNGEKREINGDEDSVEVKEGDVIEIMPSDNMKKGIFMVKYFYADGR